MSKYLIIYHAHCMDGCAAAWAAWTSLGETDCVMYPANYQEPPPPIEGYERVYIVDFSYKKDVLEEMFKVNENITIIDHHKSAQDELSAWADHPEIVFDLEHSGAVLTWQYFNPGVDVPRLLQYVEDRDLWKWELPDSLEVSTALRARGFSPDTFGSALKIPIEQLAEEGALILSYRDSLIASLVANQSMLQVVAEGTVYTVPACQAACLVSEVGHELIDDERGDPFSLSWKRTNDGKAKISLRGHDRVDCGQLARLRGGGGHPNAAGFTMSWLELASAINTGMLILK